MRQLKITHKITKRDSLALDKYLNDIGKIELIDAEEEARLSRLVREGDQAALNKLTRANLRFVISVAKQYQNQGLSLDDLINEGNLGLMKAAKRFDETKGFKFISYAVWWIRQSILQAIVENARMVRLPLNKIGTQNKLNEAYLNFLQEHEREPSPEELSEIVGVKLKDVNTVLRIGGHHLSMDAPIGADGEGDGLTILDTMTCSDSEIPETQMMNESLREEVRHGLQVLSQREIDVIIAYYGLDGKHPLTLEEIGCKYELTRERVRQIKERAIRRLRKSANQGLLRSYLG